MDDNIALNKGTKLKQNFQNPSSNSSKNTFTIKLKCVLN